MYNTCLLITVLYTEKSVKKIDLLVSILTKKNLSFKKNIVKLYVLNNRALKYMRQDRTEKRNR